MSVFKMNRFYFKAHNANEASKHAEYYKNLSWKERLKIAAYLNSIAFNFPLEHPPRLDKSQFSVRSRNAHE